MAGTSGCYGTQLAVVLVLSGAACAQEEPALAERFLVPHGLDQFPDLYRRALDTFLQTEGLYQAGEYARAAGLLDRLWADHPPGGEEWARLPRKAAGLNIGSPPCYYALRMLTDCVGWRLEEPAPPTRRDVTLTVVLVGRATGIQPTTWAELEVGTGRDAEHMLHPLLLESDHAAVHQSLWLFNEYVLAMTEGRLGVRTRVLHLPELSVPVRAAAKPHRFAGLGPGAWEAIWAGVPDDVRAVADWWWVLYPSHVPGQYPDFETTEFITGGMGRGPDGGSPCFIIDDLWLVRKPPHLGEGVMSEIERRAYLPQWVQHEFFHHLFACYPSFELEATGHQWFDRSTWPEDFEGRFEPDYLHEGLHKRIQPLGEPPMHVRLRYAPPPKELFGDLTVESVLGPYRHQPVQNDWHEGAITLDAEADEDGRPVLRWTNKAGVSWTLRPDLAEGVLRTGRENPYYDSNPVQGRTFRIVLKRDEDGDYVPEVAGFRFNQGLYLRENE